MKHLEESITLVFSRRDSRAVIIIATLLFLFLLLTVINGRSAIASLSFDILPLHERARLFVATFFDMRTSFHAGSLVLALLGATVGGINIALAYTYVRTRGELIIRSGLYSGMGLVLAFLGIGCAACGAAFLSVILSFLGFSSMLHLLPYEGLEVGYTGLIMLTMATYYLSKRLSSPYVC